MKLKISAILATLAIFNLSLSAQAKKKAPAKPAVAAKAPVAAPAAPAVAATPAPVAEAPAGPPEKAEGFNVGGNLVQSYTYNPQHPADGYNGITTWTDRANEYQLNQAWTYFEVPTDTKKKDFDFGGRVDLMYGSSYRWATSAGLEDKFKTNTGIGATGGGQYGLAIPAAYLDAAYKTIKLRVGHIISPVGFNTIDTTQNVFNTIPYTYQYGEPFTHTGAFLYWEASDKLTLMGGATRGGDNWDGSGYGSKKPGFLGTLTYIFDDKSTIDWVVHVSSEYNYKSTSNSSGKGAADAANGIYSGDDLYSWRYFQTLVYKRALTSKLQWVFQTDLGIQKVADVKQAVAGNLDKEVTAAWYGANTYLIYQALQTLQLAINFEWFRDEAGVRVGGGLVPTASTAGSAVKGMGNGYRTNYIGNFFQITFGPKWQPQKNFFVRLNGRYDYFDGQAVNAAAATAAGAGALPFFDGNKRDQFIVGLDAAFLF